MQNIKLLGIPFAFGQDKAGVKFAPDILRVVGLTRELGQIAPVEDLGNVSFALCQDDGNPGRIKRLAESAKANELISSAIEQQDLSESFLLNVGGDHGLALGTLHGMLAHHRDMVVVWADAHGDLNSPSTTPSGNFHGMPLYYLLSHAQHDPRYFAWLKHHLKPNRLIFFGPRQLDPGELRLIDELSIQYYSSEDINRRGGEVIIKEALKLADPESRLPIHMSFDVDIFDPEDVPATGTRVIKGPNVDEVFVMAEIVAQSGRLRSMDLVEVNPDVGSPAEVQATLNLVLDLVKRIVGHVFERKASSTPSVRWPHFYRADSEKVKQA
jgi:arginase